MAVMHSKRRLDFLKKSGPAKMCIIVIQKRSSGGRSDIRQAFTDGFGLKARPLIALPTLFI
jgi:hypothetical protein